MGIGLKYMATIWYGRVVAIILVFRSLIFQTQRICVFIVSFWLEIQRMVLIEVAILISGIRSMLVFRTNTSLPNAIKSM